MPSTISPSRRRKAESSDDDVEAPSSEEATDSRKSKRTRRGASPYDEPLLHSPPNQDGDEAPMQYQPGSIVRVKLTNFVTYTAVEFFPGPSLNMVIGPNGTGKSTLVCAICIGLGYDPKFLGRAKEVSEFVKHGSQEAFIEIELCRTPSQSRNTVIRCNIKREGNRTSFSVNGKPQSGKKVKAIISKLSIQIDNLCQFLPQDKVVEFAAMTPVELLRSTQRAVGSQAMIDWHEQLQELRTKQRQVQTEDTHNREILANLEGRQRMQEADVARMKEREEVKKRLEMLEDARPFAEYRAAKARHTEAKKERHRAQLDYEQLEAASGPALQTVNAKQRYRDAINKTADNRKKHVDNIEVETEQYSTKVSNIDDRLKRLEHQKETEKKNAKGNLHEAKRLEGVSERLRKLLEEGPPEFDLGACNERIRGKEREQLDLREKATELQNQMDELAAGGRGTSGMIQEAERSIKDLESKAGRQNNKLAQVSRDTAKAWDWIQANQDKFEKQVFGPPIVECSVKDLRYVNLVESALQQGELISITVQSNADLRTLQRYVRDVLRLSRVNTRVMLGGLDKFSPPIGREEMGRYGFDGWVLDYLAGPECVLAALCEGGRIHQTGIALRDTTQQQYQALEHSNVNTWVTSKSIYRVTRRREYGDSAAVVNVRDTRVAQFWSDQPVDVAAKRALQENIEGWTAEIRELNHKIQTINARKAPFRGLYDSLGKEIAELTKEKEMQLGARASFNALPTRLEQNEDKLATEHATLDALRARSRELDHKQDEATLEKAEAALDYANSVEVLRQAHDDLLEAEVMLIEANSDFEVLSERNSAAKHLLKDMRQQVEELGRVLDRAESEARKSLKVCKAFLLHADNATKEFLTQTTANQTVEDLEAEIESEKARLDLMHEGNGQVIRDFEDRQKRIDKLKRKLAEVEHALAEIGESIQTIRNKWEPKLDKLVDRISESFAHNMKQINCAGEVGVFKDENDFDQWAIQIKVKFREHEPLTQLDSHRQSGGERAVSTIFYLMSLQSLTRSPFRVVDEINQGMDPRNERLVHARMVSIATGKDKKQFRQTAIPRRRQRERSEATDGEGEDDAGDGDDASGNKNRAGKDDNSEESSDTDEDEQDGGENPGAKPRGSQYFLITPKLLHGLNYERGMRVLCIGSGEYMPTDQSTVDFGRSLAIRRGLMAAG